jgi:hypothetical protein
LFSVLTISAIIALHSLLPLPLGEGWGEGAFYLCVE